MTGTVRDAGVVARLPVEYDLLDMDLRTRLPERMQNDRVKSWGLVVGAVSGSWTDTIMFEGIDWKLTLFAPGQLKIPQYVGKREPPTIRNVAIREHCGFVTVVTGKVDVNEARDVGRPAVRGVLGLLRRNVHMLRPSEILWEGLIAPLTRTKLMLSLAQAEFSAARALDQTAVQEFRMRAVQISVHAIAAHVRRSLEWMTLARGSRIKTEKFTHLWLAVIALVKPGHPASANDGPRINAYVNAMRRSQGGPLREAEADELESGLMRAAGVRNKFIHRDESALITPELLEALEDCVYKMIDYEILPLRLNDVIL
jgi:hypothetical protein